MMKENIIGTNFIITNRDLINKFDMDTAVMLGELYGRMNYFRKRNELKFGYFFATKESVEKSTKLSSYKQRKAICGSACLTVLSYSQNFCTFFFSCIS